MLDNNKKKCCICGEEFSGYGNNPDGAMARLSNGAVIELTFKPDECCCDECNSCYVLPGRIYRLTHPKKQEK